MAEGRTRHLRSSEPGLNFWPLLTISLTYNKVYSFSVKLREYKKLLWLIVCSFEGIVNETMFIKPLDLYQVDQVSQKSRPA